LSGSIRLQSGNLGYGFGARSARQILEIMAAEAIPDQIFLSSSMRFSNSPFPHKAGR